MSSPDFVLHSGVWLHDWCSLDKVSFNGLILMQFMDADDPSINRQGTTCNHGSTCNPCLLKDHKYQRLL